MMETRHGSLTTYCPLCIPKRLLGPVRGIARQAGGQLPPPPFFNKKIKIVVQLGTLLKDDL